MPHWWVVRFLPEVEHELQIGHAGEKPVKYSSLSNTLWKGRNFLASISAEPRFHLPVIVDTRDKVQGASKKCQHIMRRFVHASLSFFLSFRRKLEGDFRHDQRDWWKYVFFWKFPLLATISKRMYLELRNHPDKILKYVTKKKKKSCAYVAKQILRK